MCGWFTYMDPEEPNYFRPCLYHVDGRITELSIPEGTMGYAQGVRDNGQVVVRYMTGIAGGLTALNGGLICQDDITHTLVGPDRNPDCDVVPVKITTLGHVIGYYYEYNGEDRGEPIPFIWQAPEHLSELETESSPVRRLAESSDEWIWSANNTGYVLGNSSAIYRYNVNDITIEAELRSLGGAWRGYDRYIGDINDFTMICYTLFNRYEIHHEKRHMAFLRVCNHRFNLNDLIAREDGLWLQRAKCINNNGVIAGIGVRDGRSIGLRLTPIR
jgi:hypothetical protein